MANMTLTVDGITFTFQNGDIDKCKSTIMSNIENSMVTGMGPMGAYNYDFEGCSKTIEISGNITPATTNRTSSGTCMTILAQKQWLESLVNGNQGVITFVSNYESETVDISTGVVAPNQAHLTPTKCKISNMSFDEESGNPLQLPFRMSLMVGQ